MRINDIVTRKIKLSEDASGIDFDIQFDDDTGSFATVTARAHGRTLGSVEFFVDGDVLVADQLEVNERYRGQGIAAAMYDYAKAQGYTIEKSPDLTPDGEHFWNKNRGEETVWEAELIEVIDQPYAIEWTKTNGDWHATVEGHWVDVFFDRSEFNGTLHITFTVNGDYDAPSQPTSASKSTVKILSTVLNVIKQKLPEYIKKSRPPGISFTSKQDNRTSLYRKYFVPVIQDILGAKWQHEEYPNMGMTVFHWKPVKKSLGESLNEIDDIKHVARKLVQLADRHLHFETQPRIHFTDSISHPTFGYFEPESNSIHIACANRHAMDIMRTLAHELVHHRQRETKGQLDGSTASGDENQANSVAGAIMRDFAQRHPEYFHDDQINEISDEMVQRYLGRADRQISRRLDRMSQARERLNKNYEIYDVNNPTKIIDRFEANTPAQAEEYYYKFIKGYNPGENEILLPRGMDIETNPRPTVLKSGDGVWHAQALGHSPVQIAPPMQENFADGKNPGRKGLAKRSGVNTKASVSSLRKTAKNSSGEKQRMAHWLANMKAGRAKARKK